MNAWPLFHWTSVATHTLGNTWWGRDVGASRRVEVGCWHQHQELEAASDLVNKENAF